MFFAGRVRGSLDSSQPIIVGVTTVYVHENVKEIEVQDEVTEETRIEYEYDEYQYDKDEYIHMMAERNQNLAEELAITQEAVDALIMMGGEV